MADIPYEGQLVSLEFKEAYASVFRASLVKPDHTNRAILDVRTEKAINPKGPMEAYQQEVVTERGELNDKLVKLTKFITDPSPIYVSLPDAEKIRLNQQLGYMTDYSNVLDLRLASWGKVSELSLQPVEGGGAVYTDGKPITE